MADIAKVFLQENLTVDAYVQALKSNPPSELQLRALENSTLAHLGADYAKEDGITEDAITNLHEAIRKVLEAKWDDENTIAAESRPIY